MLISVDELNSSLKGVQAIAVDNDTAHLQNRVSRVGSNHSRMAILMKECHDDATYDHTPQ